MSARKSPVVRTLAVVIAVVVAVVVVMQSRNGSPGAKAALPSGATAAVGASQGDPNEVRTIKENATGEGALDSGLYAENQPDEPEAPAVISLSAVILELDMTVEAGQILLDAIGDPKEREGTITTDRFEAAMALRPWPNILGRTAVTNYAGAAASVLVGGGAAATTGTGPSIRSTEVSFVADVNDDGTIAVDVKFQVVKADGKIEVLAEEWGVPLLGTRRSASGLQDVAPGETMFLRRRFGDVEMLVFVSAEVMPKKGSKDGGG